MRPSRPVSWTTPAPGFVNFGGEQRERGRPGDLTHRAISRLRFCVPEPGPRRDTCPGRRRESDFPRTSGRYRLGPGSPDAVSAGVYASGWNPGSSFSRRYTEDVEALHGAPSSRPRTRPTREGPGSCDERASRSRAWRWASARRLFNRACASVSRWGWGSPDMSSSFLRKGPRGRQEAE